MSTGVAISTTGQPHRIPMLVESVRGWDAALDGAGDSLYVTVDGDRDDTARVEKAVDEWTASVAQVGQPFSAFERKHRLGVAANKNTGLEYLMDHSRADRLWLSDDDAWPLSPASLVAHYNLNLPHSMVCWGAHRRVVWVPSTGNWSAWKWPRGSVLYVTREVVDHVGGMVEAFGTGGHEHVEWSERIHNAGFTPHPFVSPRSYRDFGYLGAKRFWYCEDMPLPGESLPMLRRRRDKVTAMLRPLGASRRADQIMEQMKGSTAFVSYRAEQNRRWSATMSGT